MSTLPSAVVMKSGVNLTGRIWSGARPSLRTVPSCRLTPGLRSAVLRAFELVSQFAGQRGRCQPTRGLRGLGRGRSGGHSQWRGPPPAEREKDGESQGPGPCVRVAAQNEDLQAADGVHVGAERARKRVHRRLLTQYA